MKSNFIIDFERLNYLTTHPNDNNTAGYNGSYCYSITRKCIKIYMDIYLSNIDQSKKFSDEIYMEAVENLNWNKILISVADDRENKIEKIITP